MPPDLILASASPRRLELLRGVGLRPRVHPSRIDEHGPVDADPVAHARRLAVEKAEHVTAALQSPKRAVLVLGADTTVVLDDDVMGKPRDDDEATGMLRRLSGREHRVITAVYLIRSDEHLTSSVAVVTRVRFRELDDRLLRWYVHSGEPRDKAGAYGIQGLGALLVASIEGSWSNVVGLPLESLPDLFEGVEIDLLSMLED